MLTTLQLYRVQRGELRTFFFALKKNEASREPPFDSFPPTLFSFFCLLGGTTLLSRTRINCDRPPPRTPAMHVRIKPD